MAQYLNSEDLISSVKRRINIPENQSTFTPTDILSFADEELTLAVVPALMSLHEDYLLFSEDVTLESGISEYVIPYRAVGNKLYDLQYVDGNGAVHEMSRTTLGDQPNHSGGYTVNRQYAYAIKSNRIILYPTNNVGGTGSLRFIYYIRPSSLVPTSEVGIITAINTSTGQVTISSTPSAFTSSGLYDFYKAKSPHNILDIDLSISSINTSLNTMQFDPTDLPRELEVGDHVSLATQCSIPQIPSDLHVFLAQKVAERILEAQGDAEGLANARAKSAEMEIRSGTIIDNRVEESPIKLVNRHSSLSRGIRSRRFKRRG